MVTLNFLYIQTVTKKKKGVTKYTSIIFHTLNQHQAALLTDRNFYDEIFSITRSPSSRSLSLTHTHTHTHRHVCTHIQARAALAHAHAHVYG